jgi:hypothetical protein
MMGSGRIFYVSMIGIDREFATQGTHQRMRWMGHCRLMPDLSVSEDQDPHRDRRYHSSRRGD